MRGLLRLPKAWNRQLGNRLVLATAIQLLMVGGAVGGLSWVAGRRSGLELAQAMRQQNAITNLSDALSQQLQAPLLINRLNALAIEQGELDLGDFDVLGKRFWRQMQLFPVGYINWGSTRGEFLGVERRDDGTLVLNEDSETGPVGRGKLAIYALDAKGRRGALLEVIPGMTATHQEPWYTETVKAGKPTWSSIYQWEDNPEVFAISYNQPITGPGNELRGVIGVDFVISQLSTWLAQVWRDSGGLALILEPNGMVVASSRSDLTLLGKGDSLRRARIDQLRDPVVRAARDQFFQAPTQAGKGDLHLRRSVPPQPPARSVRVGSTTYLLDLHPWGKAEGLNWLLLTATPRDQAMASSQAYLLLSLGLSLGAIGGAVLLTRRTITWLLAPLEDLRQSSREASNRLRTGEPAGLVLPRFQVDCAAEIEDLGTSFSTLVDQLGRQEASLRRLLNGLPVPIAVMERRSDWPLRFVNQAYQQTLGPDWNCADSEQLALWQQRRQQVLDTSAAGLAPGLEIRLRRGDGQTLPVMVFSCALDDALVEAYLDLTAIRQAQQRLGEALERERLKDAQTVLVLQSKLRSSLEAAAVAHEINLPLSTLLLHCKLLLQRGQPDLPATLVEALQTISAEAERVVLTIEKMRSLLRNVQTRHQTLDLCAVVRSALLYMRPNLENAAVEVLSEGLDQPAPIQGDAAQIQIAVVNLLRNAQEALNSQPRGGTILVTLDHGHRNRPEGGEGTVEETGSEAGDQACLRLSIDDDGPGFTDPDTALNPLETGKARGSGLGLFVVQTTMENHCGSVHLGRSARLGGASVQLEFPLEAAPPPADALPGTTDAPASGLPSSG